MVQNLSWHFEMDVIKITLLRCTCTHGNELTLVFMLQFIISCNLQFIETLKKKRQYFLSCAVFYRKNKVYNKIIFNIKYFKN